MATSEVWVLTAVGVLSYVIGAYLAVKYVLPLVRGMLTDVVKYKNTVNSFVKLLEILVYVTAAVGIVAKLVAVGDKITGYAALATPALETVSGLYFPTLKLVVMGVGILILVERIRLK
jgi:hypothetical protein